jgi:hypothetical protein
MHRTARFLVLILVVAAADCSTVARAQRRSPEPAHAVARPAVRRAAVVFVGGYFYDPYFGPYPWWVRGSYPFGYYPQYAERAIVRVIATPPTAAVYVDGFYAGVVDDFDGFFQGLPVPPGGHEIVLYLDGYRTLHRAVYLAPGSTVKLQETMERLPPGERSEPPTMAPAVPPPPEGTYLPPRSQFPASSLPGTPQSAAGTLDLRVQPVTAEDWIDGERWTTSEGCRLFVQHVSGAHLIEI